MTAYDWQAVADLTEDYGALADNWPEWNLQPRPTACSPWCPVDYTAPPSPKTRCWHRRTR